MTYIVAHRGLSAKAPENTYDSFDLAISKGINYIEFDVQLTKDKKVVIVHDETVDRTSNGLGQVKEKTLNELLSLDFGSWFSKEFINSKIPEFSKILDRYTEVNFVVEIKGKDLELVPRVMELISKSNYWKNKIYKSKNDNPNIIFCSFYPHQIEILRNYSKDIVVGFLVKELNSQILEFAKNNHIDGIFPYYKILNDEMVNKLKNEFIISSWGFKDVLSAKKLLDLKIDGITVDWPDEMIMK